MTYCPKCGSTDFKTLRMVYESGTHRISATTTNSGVLPDHTSGTQQSITSAKAAPPRKRGRFLLGCSIVVSLFFLHGYLKIFALAFLIIAAIEFYKRTIYNQITFPALYKNWENSAMCQRCGTKFVLFGVYEPVTDAEKVIAEQQAALKEAAQPLLREAKKGAVKTAQVAAAKIQEAAEKRRA